MRRYVAQGSAWVSRRLNRLAVATYGLRISMTSESNGHDAPMTRGPSACMRRGCGERHMQDLIDMEESRLRDAARNGCGLMEWGEVLMYVFVSEGHLCE